MLLAWLRDSSVMTLAERMSPEAPPWNPEEDRRAREVGGDYFDVIEVFIALVAQPDLNSIFLGVKKEES